MSVMNFDELVPAAQVRFTKINEVKYLSIRDLIMVVCDQNHDRAGKTWRNLSADSKAEVRQFLTNFKFEGRGQQIQPVITFDGALILMNWLPGENAKKWRAKTAQILKRYFSGDPTLLDDIQANAASSAPINQAARAALNNPQPQVSDQPQPEDSEQGMSKRRRIEEDRLYAECLREANPLFERRLDLQVKFCDNRERWLAIENRGENDRLEALRKQNEIELDKLQRQTDIEIDREQRLLNIERAKFALLSDKRREELEYKRNLKAFDAEPAPSAPVPAAIPDPPALTTVLKVYLQHKDSFPLLRPDQRKSFLIKAGNYAAAAYALQYGVPPSKLDEQGHYVNAFPLCAENIIIQHLRAAYRELTAGASQTTLDAAFVRQSQAVA